MNPLKNDWKALLDTEFKKDYFLELRQFLAKEYEEYKVFPPAKDIYNALHYTGYNNTKVVILGQDPYHKEGQAHGLSFSVCPGVKKPPSLRNIYKELKEDLGIPTPKHGYLKKWTEEGVLLLNAVLTVREGEAHSHKNIGWENFTDRIISTLNQRNSPVIFILWGRPAQKKEKLISNPWHYVLKSPHPSPLSAHRGFFGSQVFSKTNKILKSEGIAPIDWSLPTEIE